MPILLFGGLSGLCITSLLYTSPVFFETL